MKNIVLLILSIFYSQLIHCQFFKDQKHMEHHAGFIDFYYDNSADKVYLEVKDLEHEFLYVTALSEGVGSNDIGLDRGQLGGGVVVKFKKVGNKMLLIQPNQDYRAITDNKDERKSIEEAFAKSVLHGFVIKEEKNGVFLVDATSFFIRDAHGVVKTLEQSGQGLYRLDESRSAFNLERTKGFPKNVEFDVMLTFTGTPKGADIRSVTPDASAVTVHQHHSFVELPDDSYTPRVFDPRSGGMAMSYMDYATPVKESIVKRFIYRHRLEKKNPNAERSEAVEPIVYYLDRGTPEPIRSALMEGARWWNEAFEAIGYIDAFQVKILPEHADPLDLRYNVIQWVHRSTRGWSYGGSISDPRTGEILKGHVSLGSLRIRQDFMIAQALRAPYAENDVNDDFALEMALARIRQLAAHEVGHTLGFAHNFAASTNNRASVMDYPHPQLQLKDGKIDFSNAYATGIGDWDKVTVAYAYQDFKENEAVELQEILNKAFASGLRYASDQDARPAGSAHRYAHLWDNGGDIISELDNLLKIRANAIEHFSEDNIKSTQPYSVLEDVFVPVYFLHRYQTEAVSKIIGGLDYQYAVKGGVNPVVTSVDGATERKALKMLLKTIDVNELAIPERLLKLFPPRAMGYGRSRESFASRIGAEFDAFAAVETAAEMTLSFMLHPQRAARLVEHKSIDVSQLGLDELIDQVIRSSFGKIHKNTYLADLQNVVNYQVLMELFSLGANDNTYFQVNAIVQSKLEELRDDLLRTTKISELQRTYNKAMVAMIDDYKKDPSAFKSQRAPKIPDGSPIGFGEF
ncbi:zinc-dependent metalloprotease [Flavobacteriaceae bacterium F08102]|nr:zinc-dependent metalloprotease [Flavobacteriaceae bacterium F08102]